MRTPVLLLASLLLLGSCKEAPEGKELALNDAPEPVSYRELDPGFKDYWYAGKAEISSYRLQQARYGELREGEAVLVYVTEPFVPGKQVKADRSNPENISVLKLNHTKKFLTGIYPYSIMSSTFSPVRQEGHALKVTNSVQEWCGQVFAQLNNREQFELEAYSYFESEGDQSLSLPKTHLENDLWNQIRLSPADLPTGQMEVIPSFEYLRLRHQEFKAYEATATLEQEGEFMTYTLEYPELERKLHIRFQAAFPHRIEGWSETYRSGFGPQAAELTSSAERIKTLKSAYWQQNANKDLVLRDSLGL